MRSINVDNWQTAVHNVPVKPGLVNGTVWKGMAEIRQSGSFEVKDCSPWPYGARHPGGAMWAGVPRMVDYWRDEEGGWIISSNTLRPNLTSYYLRLCPAEPGAEVQYGFCPIKVDRSEELLTKGLGPEEGWKIRNLEVLHTPSAPFRVDEMLLAAIHLGSPDNMARPAQEFRRLLGTTPLNTLLRDMARGCYQDCTGNRDILRDRDDDYKAMLKLVCCQVRPGCLSMPKVPEDLSMVVALTLGVTTPSWALASCVYPYLYNIVMPQGIFDLVDSNLEKGIPPIVPQYVTSTFWMFNGSWGDPCTGLTYAPGIAARNPGKKLIGGVINGFNLDLAGRISYWPPVSDPPEGWVAKFTDCLRRLGEERLPLSLKERTDLALATARQIPVILGMSGEVNSHPREFARVLDYTAEGDYLKALTIRECNESGEVIESADPSVAIPEGGYQADVATARADEEELVCCDLCGRGQPVDEMGTCPHCEDPTCDNCMRTCSGCEIPYCTECMDDHGCTDCESCGSRVRGLLTGRCSSCDCQVCTHCELVGSEAGAPCLCASCGESGVGEEDA